MEDAAKPGKDERKDETVAKKDEATDKKKKPEAEEELSEEDAKLKSELEMLVERLVEPEASLYEPAIDALKNIIRTSTSSMTAVPKPLKFLRPHYPKLSALYETWPQGKLQDLLADVLSVLGMTYSGDGKRDCLHYRLLCESSSSMADDADNIGSWGHEYVRHLALEIGEEYTERNDKEEPVDDLVSLGLKIVPFFLKHNAEADAVDLVLEIERIEELAQFVDKDSYARVCLYMVSCVPLLAPPDDFFFLNTAFNIYLAHGQLTQAMALAIRIDDEELIRSVFRATDDVLVQKQLAFIVGRQQIWYEVDNSEVQKCLSNVSLSEYYLYLARELNLLDPKLPEDIYKSHLEGSRLGAISSSSSSLDSAKQNLAASFVNAFVNCGYGVDKLLSKDDDTNWIYKTKAAGMASTTASLGTIFQWDFGTGLQQLDKYLYSPEEHIKAGALMGIGIVNAGVHDESDPALALLAEYMDSKSVPLRTSAILGLGLSYAGSRREDLLEMLLPIVSDNTLSMQLSSLAALALGHIFVGSGNSEITELVLQTLLEREADQLSDKWARFMALGLALLYMGKHDNIDEVIETVKAIAHPLSQIAAELVTICGYAGTGNVIQIQNLLQACTTRPAEAESEAEGDGDAEAEGNEATEGMEVETETVTETSGADAAPTDSAGADTSGTAETTGNTSSDTGVAAEESEADAAAASAAAVAAASGYSVLGIAAVAMGEEIGQDMVLRHFGHLMHYGDPAIRRAVPLAMGLVSVSNPQMKVFDTLSRYSHDSDLEVAVNAIFAMGIVGAGTNNARLAQLLRQLASYYAKDPDSLFMVRIAQGLLHLGKGTLTISPLNTDRQILSRVSLAGLMTVSVALLDPKRFILAHSHALLYFLTTAIRPRMLVTLDENLEPLKVSVRVGQAVDVVGQAGKPKTITGWVTHSTPVLLGYGERAELEDDEYVSLASSLEGVVILRKNTGS